MREKAKQRGRSWWWSQSGKVGILEAAAISATLVVIIAWLSGGPRPTLPLKTDPATANAQAQPVQTQPTAPAVNPPSDHQNWLTTVGIARGDWGYVDFILQHESGWCPTKWEGQIGDCPKYHGAPPDNGPGKKSLGYGFCQATPADKMASTGRSDWPTNPIVQLQWCDSYAKSRYGNWANSYSFWKSHSWW